MDLEVLDSPVDWAIPTVFGFRDLGGRTAFRRFVASSEFREAFVVFARSRPEGDWHHTSLECRRSAVLVGHTSTPTGTPPS